MKRYALIKSGLVINVILWNGSDDSSFGDDVLAIECGDTVQIGFAYNGASFTDPNPVASQTLAQAQAAQIAANSAACQAAITAGFKSSALGAWYTYPSKVTDQQNLNASVVASLIPGIPATWVTPFWCQDTNGNWTYVYHTAAQIQKVGQDAKGAILTLLNKNSQLQAQVMAATKIEDVYKVTW
jgi:hypothetical protein